MQQRDFTRAGKQLFSGQAHARVPGALSLAAALRSCSLPDSIHRLHDLCQPWRPIHVNPVEKDYCHKVRGCQ